jgi:hypothetical protein
MSGLSTLSNISDIENGMEGIGQLPVQGRPSRDGEGESVRRGYKGGVFPSTRASSGVFPHDE